MNEKDAKYYYIMMINALCGLQDDFDANGVPDDGKAILAELVEICQSDFRIKYGEFDP